jgi:hypothetical protein
MWALYGDKDAQIVVCGQSHVVSVLEATLNPKIPAIGESKISVCYSTNWTSGPLPGGPEYWELVAESGRGKHVVIFWNGNQHNADFMFQTEPNFTLAFIAEANSDHGAVPIPHAMMREFFRPSFEELIKILPTLSGASSVTLANGPAPKTLSHIRASINQEKYFTDLAESLQVNLSDLVVTSDALRLELWKILGEMLAACAVKMGTRFINAPVDSRDEFGMLLPEYWTSDVTHANSSYGHLLLREISKLNGMVTS